MKLYIKPYKILWSIGLLLLSTAFATAHPIKISTSLIEYNPKTHHLHMECRVFMDDFLLSLGKNINLGDLSKEEEQLIEAHFSELYPMLLNNEKIEFKLTFTQTMDEHNVFIMKFAVPTKKLEEGDQFCFENKLFFEEFGFLQSNKVSVRMPPFFEEGYFETEYNNYAITINF